MVAMSDGTASLLAKLATTALDTECWVFPGNDSQQPLWRENVWERHMKPRLKPMGLEWATFQVMRRTFATRSSEAGVNAHTRSAQMGNTVDVNENEYAIVSFSAQLEAVRKLEAAFVG